MSAIAVSFVGAVGDFGRAAFEACFPDEVEGYDYHAAVEAAGLEGFELGWYVAKRGGEIVALVPVFFVDYDLTTTASGSLQMLARRAQPYIPGRLMLRLSCLGSPVTERCPIGMRCDLADQEASETVDSIFDAWSRQAQTRGIGLLGIKDISQADCDRYARNLRLFGLKPITGQSTASIAVPFPDLETYVRSLSAATRKDLRRKMRSRPELRVELTDDAEPYIESIMRMYLETRERSEMSFETLTPAYFVEVMRRMRGKAVLALYFHGDVLVGANLLLLGAHQLVDKYFVMQADVGRRLNLYFLSWLTNIEICIERGLTSYLSGQGAEVTKRRLGCHLAANWIYFKHQNPVFNSILAAVSPHFAIKTPEPETTS